MSDETDAAGIERKIYFFKLAHFGEIDGSLPGAMQRIANLPFTESGRYQDDPATASRLVGYPDSFEFPLKFRFGRTRKNHLPDIEEAGKLSSLDISDEAGLIDVFHLIIFNDGFVAAEFNHDGPRITKLGHYLFDKGQSLASPPVFLPLFERDIVGVVEALDNVNFLRLNVPPSAAELVREADENIYVAIEGGAKAGGGKSVELRLSAEKSDSRLKVAASRLAKLITQHPHERDRFIAASINGYQDGRKLLKPLDLLEDKLVTTSVFERSSPRSRSVSTLLAYENLEKAYSDHRSGLKYAVVAT